MNQFAILVLFIAIGIVGMFIEIGIVGMFFHRLKKRYGGNTIYCNILD